MACLLTCRTDWYVPAPSLRRAFSPIAMLVRYPKCCYRFESAKERRAAIARTLARRLGCIFNSYCHAQVKKLQAPQKQLEAAKKPKKALLPNAAKPVRPPRKPKQAVAGQDPEDALRLKVADSCSAITHLQLIGTQHRTQGSTSP